MKELEEFSSRYPVHPGNEVLAPISRVVIDRDGRWVLLCVIAIVMEKGLVVHGRSNPGDCELGIPS
jgi:hypothetical protein